LTTLRTSDGVTTTVALTTAKNNDDSDDDESSWCRNWEGGQLTDITEDSRKTTHLFQLLSVALQKGN